MNKRAFILIFDMLAGHWDENIIVPATGLQPPNVMGYAKAGKLPCFKECIDKGTFVYSWNKGICNTPYGQKYLASGVYEDIKAEPGHKTGNEPYWMMKEGMGRETILSACKKKYPDGKIGSFGSDAWMQSGWWKAPDATFGWGSYFSDFLTSQACFNWLTSNPDWKMTLLYLSQYDMTGNCPVHRDGARYTEDKHHSILQLDRFLWMIKEFLMENRWWEDTFLFIGSDHGCHYGCEVSVNEGRKRGIPDSEIPNYCSNHQPPYDCRLWDFEKDSPSERVIDCARRTAFIIGGGALDASLRNKCLSYGEIIDFAPTIAKLMDIEFEAGGKSVI